MRIIIINYKDRPHCHAAMTTLTLQRPELFASLSASRQPATKPRLRSEDLFRSGSELIIEHRGEEYRLKLTRNDKLILNK